MRIAVAGLWHLGCVTAACLAQAGYEVVAYDGNAETIAKLKNGQPPLFEPGLERLLQHAAGAGKLVYTNDRHDILHAEIVWITYDTPVDNNDVADVECVMREVEMLFPYLQDNAIVIISSQVPVGTTQRIKDKCVAKNITFACIPENLRLGKAIEVFTHPDRIVIGLDDVAHKDKLEKLLLPFSINLVWMSVVSAEMTKHAINAFLALSVTFVNELSSLCETVGANARDVELGLKSEERIGPKAYLRPGDAIAGGTLMRDINYLTSLGKRKERDTFLLSSVVESNSYHKQWSCRKLMSLLKDLKSKTIAILGLTYKAGTDTLRRSTAIETCEWLHQQGSLVKAYDPAVSQLSGEYSRFIQLESSVQDALRGVDAVVVATQWPEFRELRLEDFVSGVKRLVVLDASGFIAQNVGSDARVDYFSVGLGN